MKKIIGFIIGIILLVAIVYGCYKFFFDCKSIVGNFDNIFILEDVMDYVKIDDEAIVKLVGIDDNRCLDESCEREGQQIVKLLVLNDNRVSYVTLGTLSETKKTIDKLKYIISLEGLDDVGVHLKLSKLESKK